MELSKILQVTQKVVPFKTIAPIFIIMGVISLYLIIMTIHSDNKPNKYFYETLIIGKIDDIRHKEQYIWYKIGQDWFILLNNQTRDLSIGDSIYKKNNSYLIKVYDRTGKIKYEGEIKEIGFRTSKTVL